MDCPTFSIACYHKAVSNVFFHTAKFRILNFYTSCYYNLHNAGPGTVAENFIQLLLNPKAIQYVL